MINERLKILLKALNITQRQFALKINLDAGYFSRIIQGKVTPPDRILLLIENVFNVNKKWLEDGEGEIFISQGASLAKKQVEGDIFNANHTSDEASKIVSLFEDLRPEYQTYVLNQMQQLLDIQDNDSK